MSFASSLSPPAILRTPQKPAFGSPRNGKLTLNDEKKESEDSMTMVTSSSGSIGSASAAFASLAHSYSQLLDCMEHPQEHNVTPKEMGDLLAYLAPRLLANLTTFQPPSATSTALLQKGKVKSSFPNEKGVYEEQELHEDWIRIVVEFAHAMVS